MGYSGVTKLRLNFGKDGVRGRAQASSPRGTAFTVKGGKEKYATKDRQGRAAAAEKLILDLLTAED